MLNASALISAARAAMPPAAVISKQFFAGVNESSAFIFALLTFAAGFAVRPFGALSASSHPSCETAGSRRASMTGGATGQ
jgi:hypothetical protein